MVIQVLLLILIVLAFSRAVLRARARAISVRAFFAWAVVWVTAALVVAWPESVNRLADLVGVGRGADVVLYIAVIGLFYLVFRVFLRMESLERLLTKLVRQDALKDDDNAH